MRRVFSSEELDTDTQEDDSKGKSQARNGIWTPFPCGLERAVTELTDISLGEGSHVPGKNEDSQCRNKTNKQNLEGRSCDENVNQGVNTTQWVLSSLFLSAKTQTLHCPWKSIRKSSLPLQKRRQGQQTTATSVFTDL